MTWLVAFLALFAADFAWAICVRKVRDNSPFQAALWALGIFLPTSVGVIGYTTDPWLLIPASAGTLLGTWAGASWRN